MYTPRISMDAVLDDKLYIGNLAAAKSLADHPELGITHILSVCPEYPSQGAHHLCIPVQDTEYEDLLIHLPEACRFIQTALDAGGKVLVHCVMGISRSVTAVCAFLMVTRHMSSTDALSYVKRCRPQIHPNYGFIKQLKVFEETGYQPSPTNSTYISWKRRQAQDVTSYLNAVHDTISIIPDKLYISSEFPDDPTQAQSLLLDMGMTHVLTTRSREISQKVISPASGVQLTHLDATGSRPESLLLSLANACNYIRDAIGNGGQVLVYSSAEWKAAVIVCAYLMSSRRVSPSQATSALENALPLFNRTRNFSKQLELFAACSYRPTPDHPAMKAYLKETGGHKHASLAVDASTAKAGAAAISAIATEILGGHGLDAAAFNQTMASIQQSRGAIISHG
ncbi:phosphatases II [Heliocybe sulcata]|uniref:protein-tyrosine-phosphatase n=1 Tax=Heliocybe sulcata TaxID=5364 RepID=A0A5C3MPV4_9AGAM|nr:phosphatases II [Heliocybe sulcata]